MFQLETHLEKKTLSLLFSTIPRSDDYSGVFVSCGLPDLTQIIRGAVEEAEHEVCVVSCCLPELSTDARQCVSGLIAEQLRHRGFGAQEIYLHADQLGYKVVQVYRPGL